MQVPSLIANPGVSIPAATEDLGITYVMLGFFCASFIQFPVGYLLLERQQQQSTPQQQQPRAPGQVLSDATSATTAAGQPSSTTIVAAATAAALQSTSQGKLHCSTNDNEGPAVLALQQRPQQQQLQTLVKGVLTPPVIACLLAVPVASVPHLRDALFTPTGGANL